MCVFAWQTRVSYSTVHPTLPPCITRILWPQWGIYTIRLSERVSRRVCVCVCVCSDLWSPAGSWRDWNCFLTNTAGQIFPLKIQYLSFWGGKNKKLYLQWHLHSFTLWYSVFNMDPSWMQSPMGFYIDSMALSQQLSAWYSDEIGVWRGGSVCKHVCLCVCMNASMYASNGVGISACV